MALRGTVVCTNASQTAPLSSISELDGYICSCDLATDSPSCQVSSQIFILFYPVIHTYLPTYLPTYMDTHVTYTKIKSYIQIVRMLCRLCSANNVLK